MLVKTTKVSLKFTAVYKFRKRSPGVKYGYINTGGRQFSCHLEWSPISLKVQLY